MTMIKVRLDKVEMLLSPKQAMIAWMTEHHRQYCDEGEYSLSLAMQPERPHPLERLSGQTEAAVRDRTKGKPKQEIDQAILEAKKELGFLYQLFNDVDQFVLKELQLIRLRAALLSERMRAADERESAMNEARKLVGYLARGPLSAVRRRCCIGSDRGSQTRVDLHSSRERAGRSAQCTGHIPNRFGPTHR